VRTRRQWGWGVLGLLTLSSAAVSVELANLKAPAVHVSAEVQSVA